MTDIMEAGDNAMYQPRPIRVDHVQIDGFLGELLEVLAQNAHDIWAMQRMAEGWTWGESRNDDKKTHPCLVHYNDLPEPEREYDRILVRTTLSAILALGYRISRDA